ncbi:MAG: hypothetical protein KGD68_08465 [Candidatus Lokiarchaeota archaeon]|nr:hypothetical protein [Candidatus Lokiarchaeota archaeon]
MDFAIMFKVLEGGVSEPIKWSKNHLTPESNIIILDEGSSSVFLWYGAKQGLVSRRTALRQAESLKGHGFSVGKSIVGRDIKDLKEIDERKIGRVPENDELNDELQTLLNRGFKYLDDYTVTFDLEGSLPSAVKPASKPVLTEAPISEPVTIPVHKPEPVVIKAQPASIKEEIKRVSEYDTEPDLPKEITPIRSQTIEDTPMSTLEYDTAPEMELALSIQAKIGFVMIGVLDHYDDIWISKKEGGTYSVEHMDGKVCEFSISEGKIKFSSDSFKGISTNIKTEIQKKFVELSKLL